MSGKSFSPTKRDVTNMGDSTYCIVLNITEGIGFDLKNSENDLKYGIILKVSLNGIAFEVDGNFTQPNLIAFNSNCIWECELEDVKRIKTDNRPIKLECFFKNDNYTNGYTKHVGSLLLPLRGVKILKSLDNLQIKPYWCKLTNLYSIFRQNTPQIQLILGIFQKTIVEDIHLDAILENHKSAIKDSSCSKALLSSNLSHTLSMLQPQHGIFVKLLEDIGQIQVGNDPLQDCETFCVTLTFRQIRNVLGILNMSQKCNGIRKKSFVFQYDFLGSISNIEIVINTNDCYTINQKISLNFRSSLKSLQLYFQRVFYIPLKLYYINDVAIAKYYFDISSFLPDDIQYFTKKGVNLWTKYGSFRFDLNNTILNARASEPSVEFFLTLELLTKSEKRRQCEILTCLSNLQYPVTYEDPLNQAIEFEQKTFMYETKVKEYLRSQQSTFEKGAVKYIHTAEASNECEMNFTSNKSICSVAVNTDETFKVEESEKLYLYFFQQFKSWKQEQIKYLLNEFARSNYMQEIQVQWEENREFLIARLETKIIKCDQLFAQLENIQIQLNAIAAISLKNARIAEKITQEIESNYRIKTAQFETNIQSLRMEAQEKEIEKTILKKRINQLENQLAICQSTHLSLDQLNDVLDDMCFHNMEKLKIEILKLIDERNFSKHVEVNFCLDEIFNEEEVTLNTNNVKSFQKSSTSSLKSSSGNEFFL